MVAAVLSIACTVSERPPAADSATASQPTADTSPTTAVSEQRDCGEQTIRGERVGEIAIGDPVDSLGKCHVVRDTVVPDGEGTTVRKVFVALARDTIAATIVDGRVWRIEVSSPGLRTPDSLGVGTPLGRLLEMSNPRGSSGEGRMFVRSPDHCGQSFEIPYPSIPRGDWTRHLAELPETTRVIRVLVQRCHPALY